VTRVGGDPARPLTVHYYLTGTASPGVDYAAEGLGTVTIPAYADSAEVVIRPLDDTLGEAVETVIATLAAGEGYEMREGVSAVVQLRDDGDPTEVSVVPGSPSGFEWLHDLPASFVVSRAGQTEEDLPVYFDLGGTAIAGFDYEPLPSPLVIPAGAASATVNVFPRDNSSFDGPRTVILSLAPDAQYRLGVPATAQVSLADDEQAPGPSVLEVDFEHGEPAGWSKRQTMPAEDLEYRVEFGHDYGADGLASAPASAEGTSKGLKLSLAHDPDGTNGFAAINLYPAAVMSGEYAVRLDMYLGLDSPGAGIGRHALLGVQHAGDRTNCPGLAGGDGLWFAVGVGEVSYLAFRGVPDQNPVVLQSVAATQLADFFPSPPATAPGVAAGQWVQVELAQTVAEVSLKLDGISVFQLPRPPGQDAGRLMLGYADTGFDAGTPAPFVVFDNLRVVDLRGVPLQRLRVSGIQVAEDRVRVRFPLDAALPGKPVLETADTIAGPYRVADDQQYVDLGGGWGRIDAPRGNTAMSFYRLRR
jgi:hypothetical protein